MTDGIHGIQVALFDIAGTLTKVNAWKAIVESPETDPQRRKRLRRQIMPFWGAYKVGLYSEYRFRQRWVNRLATLLLGWTEDAIETLFDWAANTYLADHYRDDVIAELQQLKAEGVHVVLVSSIFERFAQKIAEKVGADKGIGSILEIENGKVTGKIVGQTCAGGQKIVIAEQYLGTQQIHTPLKECGVAYSDSISDRSMLEAVKVATAVYPDKRLKACAEKNGWRLITRAL